jgi:3',5'-cyclic AMP phosphodiesterase CpdA
MYRPACLLCLLAVLVSCAQIRSQVHVHNADTAAPWTHLNFQNNPENFHFAIVSDRTGGARPGVFEYAVDRLNLLRPEFVIGMGDLIEGYYTEDKEYLDHTWDQFDGLVEKLTMPFFYLPGNHDIGNEAMRSTWRERLGKEYYHFVYRDVLFLCLSTEDPPGLEFGDSPKETIAEMGRLARTDPEKFRAELMRLLNFNGTQRVGISDDQVDYVRQALDEHRDVRWTFLFMHRPAWQGEVDPQFARIEAMLGDRPYTVFAGHAHNYRYSERNGRDYIRLSTTGGEWLLEDEAGNFDHVTWVTMTDTGPAIANLLLEGVIDVRGRGRQAR